MGLPIVKVDYKFELSPNEAELFDEMIRNFSSRHFEDIMDAIKKKDYEMVSYYENQQNRISELQNKIVAGSKVTQED